MRSEDHARWLLAQKREDEFVGDIVQAARLGRRLVAHFRAGRRNRGWNTAVQGDSGSPDLLVVGRGDLWLWEAKTEGGRVLPMQERWLAELADVVRVHSGIVRPSDLVRIRRELMAT